MPSQARGQSGAAQTWEAADQKGGMRASAGADLGDQFVDPGDEGVDARGLLARSGQRHHRGGYESRVEDAADLLIGPARHPAAATGEERHQEHRVGQPGLAADQKLVGEE